MYWMHTPIEYASAWQYGYKQIVQEVRKIEDSYKNIIVTYRYDQPYVYFLFYNKTDPSWYQAQYNGLDIERARRGFGKYEFRNIDVEKDIQNTDTILVGTPDEIPSGTRGLVKEILFPDGSVAFRIVAR